MNVLVVTPSLTISDAVSTDVLIQKTQLEYRNVKVYIYSEFQDQQCISLTISKKKVAEVLADENTVLFYHHSIYWKQGFELLQLCKGKVIIKYHNITPPEFFENYDSETSELTRRGRLQTEEIVKLNVVDRYICCSGFNATDFRNLKVPEEKILIIPPFHKIDYFEKVELNEKLFNNIKKHPLNILYVGRILPHKGILNLIKVVDKYIQSYGPNIRINITGNFKKGSKFQKEIYTHVNQKRLGKIIYFVGKISFQDLHTYYSASDIFLLMSEHEGFCVPILEAQYHKLPIVALNRGAIKQTIGEKQVVLDKIDYDLFAAAIHKISSQKKFQDYLIKEGSKNYQKFEQKKAITKTFKIIEQVSSENEYSKASGVNQNPLFNLNKKIV